MSHADQLHADQLHADQFHADQLHADQLHADQLHADQLHADQLHADQLRADALRWMLTIADNHHLPVPARIDTFQLSGGWRLLLHLDDEQGDDVHRWADALKLPMRADLRVNGSRRSWTSVSACGTAPEIVFAGWESISIDSYCDHTATAAVAA